MMSSTAATGRPRRVAAAKARWYTTGAFWSSAVSTKMKKAVLRSTIKGAPLSGLEAFAGHRGQLTQKDVDPIDAVFLRYGRLLLQGKAVTDHSGKRKAKKTEEIWKMLRLVSSLLELRIRRLKWLQFIAGEIKNVTSCQRHGSGSIREKRCQQLQKRGKYIQKQIRGPINVRRT